MQKYILTTGPSLGNKIKINEIHKDNFIYRINGAHGSIEEIETNIKNLKNQNENIDILLDLPGNKIRTANLKAPIKVQKDKEFCLRHDEFNYVDFYKLVKPNMRVFANDSTFLFIVKEVLDDSIVFTSKSDGELLNNKGMHIRSVSENLPFLFDKDKALINLANQYNLSFIGASFVRRASDIVELKKLLNPKIKLISKIETLSATKNLKAIFDLVEFILIDRGDLSTEIGIEKIPRFQDYIIKMANHSGKKTFLATQILKNMEEKPIPTIAEIDDLYRISKSGVYGIQLSEESAVGKYVKECIEILNKMKMEIENEKIYLE